jgi:hypothetical protein
MNPVLKSESEETADCVYRYRRGVDRTDADLVRSAYHDGAVEDHGDFDGRIDDLVAWVLGVRAKHAIMQHVVANQHIEILDDAGVCESYFTAYRTSLADPGVLRTIGGRYVDRLARRDGRWGILERVVIHDWSRAEPLDHPDGDRFIAGRASTEDASYRMFSTLGP